jgi:hypothetical protein
MPEEQKSAWDKADILLKPLGGLLTALAVVWLGHQGRVTLENRQITEANTRLYAQLMSSREKADSELRQGMFQTIIDKILLVPPSEDREPSLVVYEQDVLRLEILAYNFHDALDLAPLFKDVYRKLTDPRQFKNSADDETERLESQRKALLGRLERVALEVTGKQVAALGGSGATLENKIYFEDFESKGLFSDFMSGTLYLNHSDPQTLEGEGESAAVGKKFQVDILEVNAEKKEIEVRLVVWPLEETVDPIIDVTFNVGFFDFPMIDNTRLQNNERCAIVLTEFQEFGAELALVYFPGSRASLKEKQFYDEIIDQLGTAEL